MQPEKGDPRIRVGVNEVRDGFRAVGARPNDTLLYHGSLSSMGMVAGGPTTVINGALAAVSPNGTVAMPTLWYHDPKENNPADFNVHTSPSFIGLLSECFRTDPRSIRSNDFSHSVSAIGPRAAELTADHEKSAFLRTPWSNRAFGDGSPWSRLYAWDALYCFIGVALNVCTMKHYIEARCVAECLAQTAPDRREQLASRLCRIGVPTGIWPWIDIVKLGELLAQDGLVTTGKIGSATIRGIRTRPLVDRTSALLRQAPHTWFGPEYLEWRADCLQS